MDTYMMIEIWKDTTNNSNYWLVTDSVRVVTQRLFPENEVSLDLRNIYFIIKCRGCRIIHENDRYIMLAPNICRETTGLYAPCDWNTNPIGELRDEIINNGLNDTSLDLLYYTDISKLEYNARYILYMRLAKRWLTTTKKNIEERKRRITNTTNSIKRELVERTWHPARFIDWCLDEEEKHIN